jgi:hypothetical protein
LKITRSHGETKLWFPDMAEIDGLMENELRKADMFPTFAGPVVDIPAFVEQHLGAHLDEHAKLDATLLGETRFRVGKPPLVCINEDLTGTALDSEIPEAGVLGRWRATVAHEAGHVVLHRRLFDDHPSQNLLFPLDADSSGNGDEHSVSCLKRGVGFALGGSDWREVQANRAMAALLMPTDLFHDLTKAALADLGLAFPLEVGTKEAARLASALANRCTVSRQAASIRLQTLGYVHPAGTRSLPVL